MIIFYFYNIFIFVIIFKFFLKDSEIKKSRKMSAETETGFGDEFKKVETRKRKSDKMEEERPYFAPISGEKMSSNKKTAPSIRTGK